MASAEVLLKTLFRQKFKAVSIFLSILFPWRGRRYERQWLSAYVGSAGALRIPVLFESLSEPRLAPPVFVRTRPRHTQLRVGCCGPCRALNLRSVLVSRHR